MKPLTDSKRYRDFISSRDRALEQILQKYLRALGQIIPVLKRRAEETAGYLITHPGTHADLKRRREDFHKRLDPLFGLAVEQSIYLLQALRRTTYALSYVGQGHAIALTTGKKFTYRMNRKDFDQIKSSDTAHGADIRMQVELAYSRLLRDVIDAFQLSQTMGSDAEETFERIARAFPRERADTVPSRKMAPMREAAAAYLPLGKFRRYGTFSSDDMPPEPGEPTLADFSTGVIEPEEWAGILDDYYSEYFPGDSYHRSPYGRLFDTEEGSRYEWQLEQDVTEDFVQKVRDGENDSAKASGITDFVWIAVIDKATDECCAWRDGLTTKEIEAKLDSQDEDCDDSLAPPLHPLCRCRLAPATEDLGDEPKPDFESFDDWLDAQAEQAS